jgi:hypothetical protein
VWPRGGFPGQTIVPALQLGFVVSFWGDVRVLARSRTTAIMANASITSDQHHQ